MEEFKCLHGTRLKPIADIRPASVLSIQCAKATLELCFRKPHTTSWPGEVALLAALRLVYSCGYRTHPNSRRTMVLCRQCSPSSP